MKSEAKRVEITPKETHLRQLADEATPHLETGLDMIMPEGYNKPAPELQLRMSNCGIATAALQGYLREAHGVETERLIATADIELPGDYGARVRHVMLRTPDGVYVDPTHGQFLSHVGLTWQVAETHDKSELYPDPKIMVAADLGKFATNYAMKVHQLDTEKAVADDERGLEIRDTGKLRGTSFDLKQDFYSRLWSPDSMEAFPLEDQPEYMQAKARKIIDHLKENTSTKN